MLTFATIADFKRVKQVEDIVSAKGDQKILDYLIRASRFVRRFTKRDFYPFVEERRYPVPHRFLDLQMRRFPTADLYFDQDCLEVTTLINGDGEVLIPDTHYFLLSPNIYPKYAVAIKFPKYWGGMYNMGIFSRHFDDPIIRVRGVWGYHDEYGQPNAAWTDTDQVVGAGGINESQRTFTLAQINGMDMLGLPAFEVGYLLKIGDEFMEIVAKDLTTKTLTVLRGVRGTTATAHEEGEKIYRWHVVDEIVEATLQIAKTWREADTAAGGRIGVSDVSSGVELAIPADPLRILQMKVRSVVGSQ